MPTYLRPGVYLEEVEAHEPRFVGAQVYPVDQPAEPLRLGPPKWMAEHSIAAFVGLSEMGHPHVPTLIQGVTEFEDKFGGALEGSFLQRAVHGFFANGGQRCYIVKVNDLAATKVTLDDFVGNAEEQTGLAGLEAVADISCVCAPDVMVLYRDDPEMIHAAHSALIAHCELMGDRVAILDGPPDMSPRQIKKWRVDIAGYDSKYAALYYPWIRVLVDYQTLLVPPSGHVAGVYARTDLHRAAGNQVIREAVGLQTDLLLGEQDFLNPIGVNALVSLPGRGLLVWGARTLSSDPEWCYLRKRRLANFIVRNIVNGTNWAVFEQPDDERVRAGIRRDITHLLSTLWRSGVLDGEEPEEAFFIKCDRENNSRNITAANSIVADCWAAFADGSRYAFRVVYFLG